MFDDVDEALRQLLIRELPVEDNEIDIAFDQPNREWSSRLNRPTLNLFLYRVHENKKLRQTGPLWEMEPVSEENNVLIRRRPIRVDLCYLVTVWTTEPEDEHRLLGRTLVALTRYAHLPNEVLPESLQGQSQPIPLKIAQEEELQNPNQSDLWSSLDNEWRLSFTCLVTPEVAPFPALPVALVRSRELRVGQSHDPTQRQLAPGLTVDRYWTIGGNLHTKQPLEEVQLRLVQTGATIPVLPAPQGGFAQGRFTIGNLRAGDYELEIQVQGRQPRRHRITVPAPDYDFEV